MKKHPEAKAAINALNGMITAQEMGKLNGEVDIKRRSAHDVAREFLTLKGLIASPS